MKKLLLSILTLLLIGCSQHTIKQLPLTSEDAIWIITDIHHLSPTLHDKGAAFQRMQSTGAGKDLVYSKERMDAFVEDIKVEKPKLLLISGDLTFNGELESFKELANHFTEIEKSGTQVLVIPGNHDISSGWARSFSGDDQHITDQISPQDFEKMFSNFGYKNAVTKDDTSLSYVAQPFSNLRFLMIDSNIYTQEKSNTAPVTNGKLKTQTLQWIEQQLKQARADNITIIPIMHHNILSHHDMLSKGYQLDNALDLMTLYDNYNVPISFSGHIHTQSIKSQNLGKTNHHEIVTQSFALTPTPIGTFKIINDTVEYRYRSLNWEHYLRKHATQNPDILNHTTYLSKVFSQSTYAIVHDALYNSSIYSIALGDELVNIISPLNERFFTGESLTTEYLNTHVYNQTAYQKLLEHIPNSFLIRYIDRSISARLNQSMQSVSVPLK